MPDLTRAELVEKIRLVGEDAMYYQPWTTHCLIQDAARQIEEDGATIERLRRLTDEWIGGKTVAASAWRAKKRRAQAAEAEVARLREALRGLLLSADASWEQSNAGHDWREACVTARSALSPSSGSKVSASQQELVLDFLSDLLDTLATWSHAHNKSMEDQARRELFAIKERASDLLRALSAKETT